MEDLMMKEMEELKNIVDSVFNVKIMAKKKPRDYVDARIVFGKILRDRGYTLESIGRFIGKDHTTIVHYIKEFDKLVYQLPAFLKKYNLCLESFMLHKDPIDLPSSEKVLKTSIASLKSQLERLTLEKEKLSNKVRMYERLDDIIKLIDYRTPKGKEEVIKSKINRMFNTIYEDD